MGDQDTLNSVNVRIDSGSLGLEPLGAIEVGLSAEERGEEQGGNEHEVHDTALALLSCGRLPSQDCSEALHLLARPGTGSSKEQLPIVPTHDGLPGQRVPLAPLPCSL